MRSRRMMVAEAVGVLVNVRGNSLSGGRYQGAFSSSLGVAAMRSDDRAGRQRRRTMPSRAPFIP